MTLTAEQKLQWVLHHDAQFHTRVGFWMAAQSVGVAIVAASDAPSYLKAAASSFFAVLAACWFVSGRNLGKKVRTYMDEHVADFCEWNRGGPKWFNAHSVLASYWIFVWVLPWLFLVCWVALAVAAGCGVLDRPEDGAAS